MVPTQEHDDHTASRCERRVPSTGLSLAVREYGDARGGGPHVVLVHGYPDSQGMWDPVVERLAGAGMHVVTYDTRGAGASDVPDRTEGYRSELLVDDLASVLDATVPAGEPAHLVGHDWGSVQLWEAVLDEPEDPRLSGRIASFTSVSGPAMDHIDHLLRHPRGRVLRLLRQAGHSWYVAAFQVPVLPELAWRLGHRPLGALAVKLDRHDGSFWDGDLGRNAANGVNLYRAAFRFRRRRSEPRRTDVPVLVVAPRRDPFLTPVTTEDLHRLCSDVTLVRPDTGHWLPRTRPDLLADLVRDHVTAHSG